MEYIQQNVVSRPIRAKNYLLLEPAMRAIIDFARMAGSNSKLQKLLLREQRYHQQRNDIDDLDQRVDCRAGRVLVGITDRVARNRGFMGI